MVATSQIELRTSFEPQPGPADKASRSNDDATQESGKTHSRSGRSSRAEAANSEPADSVEISRDAQQIAANDPGRAPRADTHQDLNATTGAANSGTLNDGTRTNQIASFEGEHTGNDTLNRTEAGRTLGQVIDTFA